MSLCSRVYFHIKRGVIELNKHNSLNEGRIEVVMSVNGQLNSTCIYELNASSIFPAMTIFVIL